MFGQIDFPHAARTEFLLERILAKLAGFLSLFTQAADFVGTKYRDDRRDDHHDAGIHH